VYGLRDVSRVAGGGPRSSSAFGGSVDVETNSDRVDWDAPTPNQRTRRRTRYCWRSISQMAKAVADFRTPCRRRFLRNSRMESNWSWIPSRRTLGVKRESDSTTEGSQFQGQEAGTLSPAIHRSAVFPVSSASAWLLYGSLRFHDAKNPKPSSHTALQFQRVQNKPRNDFIEFGCGIRWK